MVAERSDDAVEVDLVVQPRSSHRRGRRLIALIGDLFAVARGVGILDDLARRLQRLVVETDQVEQFGQLVVLGRRRDALHADSAHQVRRRGERAPVEQGRLHLAKRAARRQFVGGQLGQVGVEGLDRLSQTRCRIAEQGLLAQIEEGMVVKRRRVDVEKGGIDDGIGCGFDFHILGQHRYVDAVRRVDNQRQSALGQGRRPVLPGLRRLFQQGIAGQPRQAR